MMDELAIETAVIETITEIQKISGESTSPILSETCPLTGIPGFDSLRAMEVITALSKKIGKDLNERMGLFWDEKNSKPYAIKEIAHKIANNVGKKG
jgi:acyl carrier protein